MESNFKMSKTESSYKPLDIFNDKATKSKIYRHLVDINDVISEDDIRNVKVSFSDMAPSLHSKEEEKHPHRAITPWDVLDVEA